MVNRRRHTRAWVRAPVEFTPWDPKHVAFGFATDVSIGGAFVETTFPSPSGSEVVLRLWWPGRQEEVLLPSVVRWTGNGGMGVEFVSIGSPETEAIRDLVTAGGLP